MLIFNNEQINNIINNFPTTPIFLNQYFAKDCLNDFLNYLNNNNFPLLIFENSLGGDLTLLPEIKLAMSKKCCIGVVKNYIASLHLAIFGLSTIKIYHKNSRFIYHTPIFPQHWDKQDKNKLLNDFHLSLINTQNLKKRLIKK